VVSFKDVRFTRETRVTLTTQQVVEPLDDRFRFRPSGDEGPAGWWLVVQYSHTYGEREIRMDPVGLTGALVTEEISPSNVVSISGAVLDAS